MAPKRKRSTAGLGRTNWPDVHRIAFGRGPDSRLDAQPRRFLGPAHAMSVYAEGYREAAEALYRRAKRVRPGYLLFPLAFLWRHYVELALKQIIALGGSVDGKAWTFPHGHRLPQLWSNARPYIESCAPEGQAGPEVANVAANIKELDRIDADSTAFRYSEGNGKLSVPNAPNLNLRVLHDAMVPLANLLDGVAEELAVRLDYVQEMLAEGRAPR